jgi:hypothetical protein
MTTMRVKNAGRQRGERDQEIGAAFACFFARRARLLRMQAAVALASQRRSNALEVGLRTELGTLTVQIADLIH